MTQHYLTIWKATNAVETDPPIRPVPRISARQPNFCGIFLAIFREGSLSSTGHERTTFTLSNKSAAYVS